MRVRITQGRAGCQTDGKSDIVQVVKKSRSDLPQEDADRLREGLSRFLKSRRLTISGWCQRAGITEGTLRSFLSGRSKTLTHATLAALAYAAREPITALLSGRSVWGNTEVIDVTVEVRATERSGESIFLEDDKRYQIRVPTHFPNQTKFAAQVMDTSADEKWRKNSLLICADLGWESSSHALEEGDFLVIEEKRNEFVSSEVKTYIRCTVRELVREGGHEYLVMRSRSPLFRESITLHNPLINQVIKDPILTGLGTQIAIIGKVLASYGLEIPQGKCLSAHQKS